MRGLVFDEENGLVQPAQTGLADEFYKSAFVDILFKVNGTHGEVSDGAHVLR